MTSVRLIPAFADDTDDQTEARLILARLLDDPTPGIMVMNRDAGAQLLDDLAAEHEGCEDLAKAAHLLRGSTHSHLVLGWTPGWASPTPRETHGRNQSHHPAHPLTCEVPPSPTQSQVPVPPSPTSLTTLRSETERLWDQTSTTTPGDQALTPSARDWTPWTASSSGDLMDTAP